MITLRVLTSIAEMQNVKLSMKHTC